MLIIIIIIQNLKAL